VQWRHSMFDTVERECTIMHRTTLYRVLGIPIPAITIGRYTDKQQLCSFCTELGYCQNKVRREEPAWDI
jgi:hypothetical protein